MAKLSILVEFFEFIKYRKKWWLTPIIIFLVLLGALLIFAEGSAIPHLFIRFFNQLTSLIL